MGMYNEALLPCPHCPGVAVAQIHQIVLGFGEFRLSDPAALAAELTVEQLAALDEATREATFTCRDCGQTCRRSDPTAVAVRDERAAEARRRFG